MPLDAILVKFEKSPCQEGDAICAAAQPDGLAAVPGGVRARRLRALAKAGKRALYVACYDLVADDVLMSEAWLAVRRTPWSDRVRPTFRGTTRTLFRTVARIPAAA